MNRNKINYFFVGVLVISMAVVLVVVLFELTGRDENTDPYYAVFNNVTNIQVGSTVTFGGFPVGYVKDIQPLREATDGGVNKTRFRLLLALKKGWHIPVDSEAKIYTPGMLADTLVEIEEGRKGAILHPGETIATREEPEIMALLGDVAGEIKALTSDSVQPLIQATHELLTSIGGNVDQNIQQISQETLVLLARLNEVGASMEQNINQVSRGTTTLLSGLENNSQQLSGFINDANAQHISNMLENADHMTRELSVTVKDLGEAGKNLNQLLRESNALVQDNKHDIRVTVAETRNTLQTISDNIESIVFQLDNTGRNMNEFSRRIKESPSSLIQARPLQDNAE